MNNHMKLIGSKQTVFTVDSVKMILGLRDESYVRLLLHRMKKQWIFLQPMRGYYAFSDYNIFELATKLQSKSYISFETALLYHGIIFQNYEHTIVLAGPNTLTKHAWWKIFQYHKLKDTILSNPLWVIYDKWIAMAGPERAVCDMIYLSGNFYFDNPSPLDLERLEELKSIYPKSTALLITQFQQHVRSELT